MMEHDDAPANDLIPLRIEHDPLAHPTRQRLFAVHLTHPFAFAAKNPRSIVATRFETALARFGRRQDVASVPTHPSFHRDTSIAPP
jgi:hypothetical protein